MESHSLFLLAIPLPPVPPPPFLLPLFFPPPPPCPPPSPPPSLSPPHLVHATSVGSFVFSRPGRHLGCFGHFAVHLEGWHGSGLHVLSTQVFDACGRDTCIPGHATTSCRWTVRCKGWRCSAVATGGVAVQLQEPVGDFACGKMGPRRRQMFAPGESACVTCTCTSNR